MCSISKVVILFFAPLSLSLASARVKTPMAAFNPGSSAGVGRKRPGSVTNSARNGFKSPKTGASLPTPSDAHQPAAMSVEEMIAYVASRNGQSETPPAVVSDESAKTPLKFSSSDESSQVRPSARQKAKVDSNKAASEPEKDEQGFTRVPDTEVTTGDEDKDDQGDERVKMIEGARRNDIRSKNKLLASLPFVGTWRLFDYPNESVGVRAQKDWLLKGIKNPLINPAAIDLSRDEHRKITATGPARSIALHPYMTQSEGSAGAPSSRQNTRGKHGSPAALSQSESPSDITTTSFFDGEQGAQPQKAPPPPPPPVDSLSSESGGGSTPSKRGRKRKRSRKMQEHIESEKMKANDEYSFEKVAKLTSDFDVSTGFSVEWEKANLQQRVKEQDAQLQAMALEAHALREQVLAQGGMPISIGDVAAASDEIQELVMTDEELFAALQYMFPEDAEDAGASSSGGSGAASGDGSASASATAGSADQQPQIPAKHRSLYSPNQEQLPAAQPDHGQHQSAAQSSEQQPKMLPDEVMLTVDPSAEQSFLMYRTGGETETPLDINSVTISAKTALNYGQSCTCLPIRIRNLPFYIKVYNVLNGVAYGGVPVWDDGNLDDISYGANMKVLFNPNVKFQKMPKVKDIITALDGMFEWDNVLFAGMRSFIPLSQEERSFIAAAVHADMMAAPLNEHRQLYQDFVGDEPLFHFRWSLFVRHPDVPIPPLILHQNIPPDSSSTSVTLVLMDARMEMYSYKVLCKDPSNGVLNAGQSMAYNMNSFLWELSFYHITQRVPQFMSILDFNPGNLAYSPALIENPLLWQNARGLPGDWSAGGISRAHERFFTGFIPTLDLEVQRYPELKHLFQGRAVSQYPGLLFKYSDMNLLTYYRQVLPSTTHERSAVVALKLLVRVLSALHQLYRQGIFHKDVKPDNFIVTSMDSAGVPYIKLTGFNVARNVGDPNIFQYAGSYVWIAPEIGANFWGHELAHCPPREERVRWYAPHSYTLDIWSGAATVLAYVFNRLPWSFDPNSPHSPTEGLYSILENGIEQHLATQDPEALEKDKEAAKQKYFADMGRENQIYHVIRNGKYWNQFRAYGTKYLKESHMTQPEKELGEATESERFQRAMHEYILARASVDTLQRALDAILTKTMLERPSPKRILDALGLVHEAMDNVRGTFEHWMQDPFDGIS
jgi:serine/threonine protein kinase